MATRHIQSAANGLWGLNTLIRNRVRTADVVRESMTTQVMKFYLALLVRLAMVADRWHTTF